MNGVADVIFYVIVVAILYMLVRPGSPAASAVSTVADAAAHVVARATGA